ncbi:MAG: tetratricopeptide repeat protein [Anaerolineae bacterium]
MQTSRLLRLTEGRHVTNVLTLSKGPEPPECGCQPYASGYNDDVSGTSDRLPFAGLAILAVLIASLLLALRSSGNEYAWLLHRAQMHVERAERTDAVAIYREAAQRRPEDPRPHLELAKVYLGWGRLEEAMEAVADAEELGGDRAELSRLRVLIHAEYAESATRDKLSHWEAVVGQGETLLSQASENHEACKALADAYLALREWGAARSVYEELLGSNPEDAMARERLGVLLVGFEPVALDHLRLVGTALSETLLTGLENDRAVDEEGYVHALAGRILVKHQEWGLAVRHLGRAVAYAPDYADGHAYLGHALDRVGYEDEARSHLLEAVELAPTSVVAHAFLGLHYDRRGDASRARVEYETAYDLAPQNPALCVEIGQTWVSARRYVVAELWLREAVTLKPDDPALWEVLTRFYLDHAITSDDRAIRAAERLLALAPKSAEAHDLRGWAAFHAGEHGTAEQHLRRAIELDEELASAYYHLGHLRREQGREREATSAFDRAVDLDTRGTLAELIARSR